MCGRYSLTRPVEEIRESVQFTGSPNLQPRYNIAPTQAVPVVIAASVNEGERPGRARILMMRWGLRPPWMQPGRAAQPLINARAETVRDKPAFRAAATGRRCLVPADGFYEWQGQGRGKPKQPYFIHLGEHHAFAFAGIFERDVEPGGGAVYSVAILTMDANSALAPIHARMPVILHPQDHDPWLEPGARTGPSVLSGLRLWPATAYQCDPVSTLINNVRNDTPACQRPETQAADQATLL